MEQAFEELDHQQTALGELILRRRRSLSLPGAVVYEVKLDGEFLMSSLVRRAEEALATLTLRRLGKADCAVLVGGLGLGHTAEAALREPNVGSVEVIEYLRPVIDWHERGLVPAAETLMGDDRCRLVERDFYEFVGGPGVSMSQRYDAILVDIDHAPDAVLHPDHAAFYTRAGLERLTHYLRLPGVFGLWSAAHPSEAFLDAARSVFGSVDVEEVRYVNLNLGEPESNWIVIGEWRDDAGDGAGG